MATGGTPPRANIAGTPSNQTYPFRPATLTLPSGTVAAVDAAGVDPAGALQVPSDPARVGWWTGGALVGEAFGNVVLAGHVDSAASGAGAMFELLDIATGDEIAVGDGTREQRYRVASIQELPKVRLAADAGAFDQQVDHRLVLITCSGPYDSRTRSYADNVVVVAVPVAPGG